MYTYKFFQRNSIIEKKKGKENSGFTNNNTRMR